MPNIQLTKEEYEIINSQRQNMIALAHNPPLSTSNPPHSWLKAMQPIHQRLFGGSYPNIGCNECVRQAFKKFYPKVLEFEQWQEKE